LDASSASDHSGNDDDHDRGINYDNGDRRWQHLYVLPVLLFEFLALALTRAVLPSILLQKYGSRVYLVMGCVDFVRGFLAFVACPIFGKISDIVGRRICLFVTVLGTCAPVSSLALFSWEKTYVDADYAVAGTFNASSTAADDALMLSGNTSSSSVGDAEGGSDEAGGIWPIVWESSSSSWHADMTLHPTAITVFVVLLSLSGIFSSTFTLVFAYISDSVRNQDERVSAYGLALATFGLSFTIGPMAGGYLARYNKQYVFVTSLLLTVVDLLYIYFVLPESRDLRGREPMTRKSGASIMSDHNISWNPWDTVVGVPI